jgi:RNA polymerase sigma factor (sigma-70 family)
MDARAFEELVVRHQGAVCGVAYAVLGDRARSEEVAQEAFLLAWRRLADAPVSAAWICGVARNLARNAARRRREVMMDEEPIAAGADARDQMIAHEDAERARVALAALPAQLREAIVVYYHGEESMAAVATALDCSHAAAKQRVHRGRTRLREALAAVETTLRARRPGAAFTGACVAAWLALDAGKASASNTVAAASTPIATSFASAAAWLVGIGIAGGIAAAATPALEVTEAPPRPHGIAMQPVRSSLPAPPPSLTVSSGATSPAASGAVATIGPHTPVSIKFRNGPFGILVSLIANEMNVPIRLDGALDDVSIDIDFTAVPALEALDQALARVKARRIEIGAIKIVEEGGRTDASTLGGGLVTIHLDDVSLLEAVDAIQAKLPLPIARDVKPNQLPGPTNIEGELYILSKKGDPQPEYVPHVTLHVTNVPAGTALELVLEQSGLGFIETTGYQIVPH